MKPRFHLTPDARALKSLIMHHSNPPVRLKSPNPSNTHTECRVSPTVSLTRQLCVSLQSKPQPFPGTPANPWPEMLPPLLLTHVTSGILEFHSGRSRSNAISCRETPQGPQVPPQNCHSTSCIQHHLYLFSCGYFRPYFISLL